MNRAKINLFCVYKRYSDYDLKSYLKNKFLNNAWKTTILKDKAFNFLFLGSKEKGLVGVDISGNTLGKAN